MVTKAVLTVHVFLSQLICYSEVCSYRVNTHLEVDNGQHESVISDEILVAIYCCYSDKYRPQTGDDYHGPTLNASRGGE